MMSPQIDDDDEIASLVEETTGTGSQRPANSSTRGSRRTQGSFRSCWLIALALVAALFVGAFIADTMEINTTMGAASIQDKVESNSSSPKKLNGKSGTAHKSKSSSASTEPPPLVHSPPVQEPGYKGNPATLSDTYLPRGKPINATDKEALAQKYGTWTLVDPKAD